MPLLCRRKCLKNAESIFHFSNLSHPKFLKSELLHFSASPFFLFSLDRRRRSERGHSCCDYSLQKCIPFVAAEEGQRQ